jgi:predicted DsbA family dithiol-disulfide isomerase
MAETQHSPVLAIDVVSDVVCPWCFVGKRRLARALASRPDLATEVRWRPFQLDPTIPAGGLDRKAYLEGKFGTDGRIEQIHQRLEEIGAAEGIAFDFGAIARSPNTLDAHRLIRWAGMAGRQDAVVEALFRAYFEEGRDIGDREVLTDIGTTAGLPRDALVEALAADEDRDAVEQEIRMAGELGVRGVPFFIMGGRYAVSGAEAPENLAAAMDAALAAA